MKIGIISDIHGNLFALETVLCELKKKGVRQILNAGDIIGYSPFPNECVDILRNEHAQSVLGNMDEDIAFHNPISYSGDYDYDTMRARIISLQWTQRHTNAPSKKYLASLPKRLRSEIEGTNLFTTHGGLDSSDEFIHEKDKRTLQNMADILIADIVILGHTHRPYVTKQKGKLFVNPGSVGKPEDGDPRASFAVVDLVDKSAALYRVSYNISKAIQAVLNAGLPDEIAMSLSTGRVVLRTNRQVARIA